MGFVGAIPARLTHERTNMNAKQITTTVQLLFAAFTTTLKSDATDYEAMAKALKTLPLNDAEAVKAFRDETLRVFGDSHKDAAQIRINIVNNARRVAYGGSKDGKQVRGKGLNAMLETVASVKSVRELKKALAEAVPAQLKGESGGNRKPAKKTGKGDAIRVDMPKEPTREQAFAAARKVLEFVRDKIIKPSETDTTTKINAVLETLK